MTLKDISAIPQQKWRFITTAQAMVPLERLVHVSPDNDLMDAMQTMDSSDVAQVPVVRGGELVGVLSRELVLRYLRLRAELGM